MCTSDIFLALIAVLFPPLPVWIKRGLCSCDSLINILLTLLAYIPGLIHAWFVIYTTPDYDEYQRVFDVERLRHQSGHGPGNVNVTYYYVEVPPSQAPQNYGSVSNPQQQSSQQAAAPSAQQAPPSYNQAVQGDNKIQRT